MNIDVVELKEDLKKMTIEEVLLKYKLDWATLFKLTRNSTPMGRKRKRKRVYKKCDEKYIYLIDNRYCIKKTVRGKHKSFGGYDALEDAVKVRDYLEEHGWYQHRLKTAWRKCGVKKEEW